MHGNTREDTLSIVTYQHSDQTFREIVEANKKPVYFLALNLSGNHQDAEDLSQDVFIKVHQSMDQFRGQAQLKTWLYRITVNAFIDKKRKKILPMIPITSGPMEEYQSVIPEEKSPSANPEDQTEAHIIQEHIRKALNLLSPRERAAFVLKHYKGHSIKEIAQIVHTTEGTVKSHLFRAIRKMRDALSFYKAELGLEEK